MNRRPCSLRHWIEICTTTALMGLSALVGMLALEYLVTGDFGAAKEYSAIALLITVSMVALQWRRHRAQKSSRVSTRNRARHSKTSVLDS